MTTTDKPVQRVTREAFAVLYASKAERIVIRLERNLIRFRLFRRRQVFDLPVEAGLRYAIEREAARALAHSTPRILGRPRRRAA